jgi:uncharacterized protein YcfL
MKKILALVLVLCLFGTLAACTDVTRISIEDPAKIMLEKAGGSVAITLTDTKTVQRITDLVEQIPLQASEATEDQWTYRIVWQDADGGKITEITIAGAQIRWEGKCYNLGIGVDISAITDVLETIPGLEK